MVLPWMVLPSQDATWVGITPLGAAHSTTLMPAKLLGDAKAELAGKTTLMLWPLAKGMPAVNPVCGCAAVGTIEPLAGPAAPALTTRPREIAEATSNPMPDSCTSVQ